MVARRADIYRTVQLTPHRRQGNRDSIGEVAAVNLQLHEDEFLQRYVLGLCGLQTVEQKTIFPRMLDLPNRVNFGVVCPRGLRCEDHLVDGSTHAAGWRAG
jgi:hypothetical protein